jgi:Tol biopolymer transport system component
MTGRPAGFAIAPVLALAATLAGTLASAVRPAMAQRRPVLDQIDVPHNYYYREMYLPQATTGPSSVSWSPDGRTLVFSMQGSLWMQDVASTEAYQLTDGPGYDYQPDWSPDGARVVYSSYRGNAEELWVVNVATRISHQLTATGAVNVEPRWSPDGKQLAWVSTALRQRWHIYVAPFDHDSIGNAVQITTDHDSHLPRYYYSVYDHYLSPSWSTDGKEILFVSNRGHIWGTGGIWRARVGATDSARQIRDEETTWKARPDWSPDGARVVYSSYLGRQWNQLWLMRADGGDALQLTYGDYDATAPRWSRDGRRIAYIVNAIGNTALRIIDVPGGQVTDVRIASRHYESPSGTVRIVVTDSATGRAVPARISVTGPDGRSFAPDDTWRYADDAFDRNERRLEIGYFQTAGESVLTVPAGEFSIDVVRGLEYRRETRHVHVAVRQQVVIRIPMHRIADLAAAGWYSGDVHVHMNYGGAYRNDPAHLKTQARAEDLRVIENLIVNKEQRVPDVGYFTGRLDPVSDSGFLLFHGQEFHTSYWGHFGVLAPRSHVLLPGYAAYTNTAAASLVPTNADVADLARAQGALAGYVHPFDTYPQPADTTQPLTDELPTDIALGKADYMEIVGFSDHRSTAHVWYQLLNCGFRIPAAAGTDAMANYASLRGPVGLNRVYVHVDGRLTHDRWLAGLKAGRTFATNGPLLGFTIDGHGIGDVIRFDTAGHYTMHVHVRLRSVVPVDHLEIVSRGRVIWSADNASHPLTSADVDTTVAADSSGWYTLRAWSGHATAPIMDIYPFATTSPIYVEVADEKVRSPADKQYFLTWLARLDANVRAYPWFNTEAERTHVLGQITAARAEFEKR